VLDVNLRGVVYGVQAAYPVMLRQGFGHIVNTASMAGLIPAPNIVSYATTKHAVVGLSKSLRIEAEPAGVRVSVLCPGVIRTAILDGGGKFGKALEPADDDSQREQFERLRPMDPKRFAVQARNKAIVVIPWSWKLVWWLERLSPALSQSLSRRRFAQLRRSARVAGKDVQRTSTPGR
jgi:short-subunit dehydrogenase